MFLKNLYIPSLNPYVTNLLYVIAFLLPLALPITTPLIYLTLCLALLDKLYCKSAIRRLTLHNYLFLLWVGLAALSVGKSPNIDLSWYNYKVLFGQYVSIYFLSYFYITDVDKLKKLLYSLLASGFFVSLYGIYQYIDGVSLYNTLKWVDISEFPGLSTRVFSTLSNPNLLAAFLSMSICLNIGCILDKNTDKRYKNILYITLFVSLVCLLFTFSRGAWLSLAIVVALLGIFIKRKILYIFLVLVAVSFVCLHDVLAMRIMSILNPTDTSATLRIAFWESTVAMIEEHPWGIGWAAYQFVYPEYDFFINDSSVIIYHAHNMYLHMASEIGIVGGFIYTFLLICPVKFLYNVYKIKYNTKLPYVLAIITFIFMVLLLGITDYPLYNIQISCIVWLIIAASYSLKNN